MSIATVIDKAIATFAPETALKRVAARQKIQILNSGYGNYGANTLLVFPNLEVGNIGYKTSTYGLDVCRRVAPGGYRR